MFTIFLYNNWPSRYSSGWNIHLSFMPSFSMLWIYCFLIYFCYYMSFSGYKSSWVCIFAYLLSSFHSLNGFIWEVEILNFVSNLLHFSIGYYFLCLCLPHDHFFPLKALFFLHLPFSLQFIWNWFKHMLHGERWDSFFVSIWSANWCSSINWKSILCTLNC